MFSQTVEYALRAIVFLADAGDDAVINRTIAERTQVPPGYLSKVLQSLGRAKLVTSRRGPIGGFVLARLPDDITVLDVINAVDPIKRINTCPLDLKSHGSTLCPLHRKLDDAIAQIESAFASTSIADLLATSSPSRPLCENVSTSLPMAK